MSVVKIGYWNCRGLIEPIRLLLEYAGTPYEFTGQECGPAPHYDKVVWMAKKSTVLKDYDFPNLPYYDDGEGIKLTHSVAIVQHLGRTYGLVPPPDSVREWADLDLYREQILELRDAVVNYVYFSEHRAKGVNPTSEEISAKKSSFMITAKAGIELMALKNGGSVGPWMIGKRLTYVDFLAYEFVDQVRSVLDSDAERREITGTMMDVAGMLESLPQLSDYFRDRRKKFPVYSERSFIGKAAHK